MPMEISILVNGKMIKLMALVTTPTLMAPSMRESGSKINNTAKAERSGQMVLSMKVNIKLAKKMVMENFYGLTTQATKVISRIIISMVKEHTNGLTVDNTPVIGKSTRCMAQVFSLGLMEDAMKETITTIRNKVKASLHGLMVESTMASGRMANKKVSEST